MTDTESEVFSLIHSSKNPELALEVAIKLALEFLEPHEVSPCKTLEPLSEVS